MTGSGASTRLDGRASGRFAAAGGSGAASGSVTLQLEPSRVGALELDGGTASVELAGGTLRGDGSVRLEHSEATFRADAVLGPEGPSGHARVALPFRFLEALAGRDSLDAEGEVRAEATFSGRDAATAVADLGLRGSGRIGACTVDSVLAALRLADGALAVDSLAVRSNAGTASASGRVVLGGSDGAPATDLRAEISVDDPAPLRSLLGPGPWNLDGGRLEASLTGPADARAFAVHGTVQSPRWEGTSALEARTELSGVLGEGWRPARATATADLFGLRTGGIFADRVGARADLDGAGTELELSAVLDDSTKVALRGAAARDSAETRIRLDDVEVARGATGWRLMRPAEVRIAPGRVSIDSLEVRSGTGVASVAGTLDRQGEEDLRLRFENVGLDVLGRWVGRDDVKGRLDGHLAVTGSAREPQAEGDLRMEAVAAGAPAGVAEAALRWDGRQARVQARFASPDLDSLTVSGRLPFVATGAAPDSASVDLRVAADRFPLRSLGWLLPPEISDLQGELTADVHVSGPVSSPRGRGRIEVSDAALHLASLGVGYRDLQLDAVASGDRIEIREARARSEKGTLQATGSLRLGGSARIEPDLHLTSQDFLFVDAPDLRVQASADLQVTGSAASPGIAGRLTLRRCDYYLTDEAIRGAQSTPVTLTPEDVRMMREAFDDRTGSADSTAAALWEASDLDLDVTLEHDNWLRKRVNPRLAVEITGQVHARKPAHGELDLRGRIAPVPGRGYVEQFGRTFTFSGGEVALKGKPQDHTVDIQAEYDVIGSGTRNDPEVVVRLDVKSEGDRFTFTLSSDPPLPEEEIVAYVTTGHGRTDLPSPSESSALALATDIGLAQVTGGLEQAAQQKAGLDVLQFRYDSQLGTTLVAGQYLDPKVYVGFRQPIQYHEKSGVTSQNPYQTEADVEVQLLRWLAVSLQAEVNLLRSFIRASHEY